MRMSKMLKIRNVPDVLHRKLEARAAMAGMSLSDYLLSELRRTAEVPTLGELSKSELSSPSAIHCSWSAIT